jgi:3-phenylpropionate/trans-cinnamate dioxygenase ferredoxin subunit
MAEYTDAGPTSEVPSGTMKKVILGDREILLAHIGNAYYAANNTCPHMGGDLSKGTLEGTVVTCPNHHSQFDLRDGHVVRWTDLSGIVLAVANVLKPPRTLKTHEVKIEGERILVRLR